MLRIVEQPEDNRVHPLLAHRHEHRLPVVEQRRLGGRLREFAGRKHQVEFGEFLRQSGRFLDGGVGKQDQVIGLVLHLRHDSLQSRPRIGHRDFVVDDLFLISFPNDGGDGDSLAASRDDAIQRHHLGLETEEAHIRRDEGAIRRRAHHGRQHAGRQPQVARPQGDARVAGLHHPLDRRLELDFRLRAEPLGDVADVEADHRPAAVAQRPEEGVSPAHAALHAVQSGAAARLEVSVLPAGHHKNHLRLGPIDEDRPVFLDRVEGSGGFIAWPPPLRRGDGLLRLRCGVARFGDFANGQFGAVFFRRVGRLRRRFRNRLEFWRRPGQGPQVRGRRRLLPLCIAGRSVRGNDLFSRFRLRIRKAGREDRRPRLERSRPRQPGQRFLRLLRPAVLAARGRAARLFRRARIPPGTTDAENEEQTSGREGNTGQSSGALPQFSPRRRNRQNSAGQNHPQVIPLQSGSVCKR